MLRPSTKVTAAKKIDAGAAPRIDRQRHQPAGVAGRQKAGGLDRDADLIEQLVAGRPARRRRARAPHSSQTAPRTSRCRSAGRSRSHRRRRCASERDRLRWRSGALLARRRRSATATFMRDLRPGERRSNWAICVSRTFRSPPHRGRRRPGASRTRRPGPAPPSTRCARSARSR